MTWWKGIEILLSDLLYIESLNRDLTSRSLKRDLLWRSLRGLVQIALQRDLAQQLLQRTCQEDLAHNILQRSSQRELAESKLVSLLPGTTFDEHHTFTSRVTLVLLAWNNWWCWVLSPAPLKNPNCAGTIQSMPKGDYPWWPSMNHFLYCL
jgi:hypothetical protein